MWWCICDITNNTINRTSTISQYVEYHLATPDSRHPTVISINCLLNRPRQDACSVQPRLRQDSHRLHLVELCKFVLASHSPRKCSSDAIVLRLCYLTSQIWTSGPSSLYCFSTTAQVTARPEGPIFCPGRRILNKAPFPISMFSYTKLKSISPILRSLMIIPSRILYNNLDKNSQVNISLPDFRVMAKQS